jgi:hypothetical protein
LASGKKAGNIRVSRSVHPAFNLHRNDHCYERSQIAMRLL